MAQTRMQRVKLRVGVVAKFIIFGRWPNTEISVSLTFNLKGASKLLNPSISGQNVSSGPEDLRKLKKKISSLPNFAIFKDGVCSKPSGNNPHFYIFLLQIHDYMSYFLHR